MTTSDALLSRLLDCIPSGSTCRWSASSACSPRSATRRSACRRSFMSPEPTARARPSPSCGRSWKPARSAFTSTPAPSRPLSASASPCRAKRRQARGSDVLSETLAEIEQANGGGPDHLFRSDHGGGVETLRRASGRLLLLEVGLGGRFDATDVIPTPACAVITPISIDHVEFLAIRSKRSLLKRPESSSRAHPSWPRSKRRRSWPSRTARRRDCARRSSSWPGFSLPRRTGPPGLSGPARPARPALAAPARPHQIVNAGTAIAAVRQCAPNLPHAAFEHGMVSASWPGRLQISGAENWRRWRRTAPSCGSTAATTRRAAGFWPRPWPISRTRRLGRWSCSMAACKPRTLKDFLRHFAGLAAEVVAVPVRGEQAGRTPAEISALARGLGMKTDVQRGAEEALRALAARPWAVPPES